MSKKESKFEQQLSSENDDIDFQGAAANANHDGEGDGDDKQNNTIMQ